MKVKNCVVCGNEHTKIYGKCCSKECSNILRKRTCKELYGFEVSSQNPDVKKKFQETCEKLYGGHPAKNEEVKAKIRATNQEKYGFENASQSPEVQAKIKETNQKRYNGHPLQNEKVRSKIKATNQEKYGADWVFQSPEIQDKVKSTNLKKYGTETPSTLPEIQAKMKATNMERFGYENAAQSPEIQAKIKDTNLKLYGFENVSNSPEIQERKRQTNLKNRGTEYPTQCQEVMDKQYATNTIKYGTFCVFKNEEIKDKIKSTNLKKYDRENTAQVHIKNYDNYTREYILENFTTNGVVSLSQRAEMRKYYGISDEGNTLRKLKEWGIPAEICQSYSFAEKRVLKYLQDKYPKLTFIENDRSLIKNNNTGKSLELDIVVKKDDDIICAIEYNGIYWHDKNNQIKEVRKSNLCAAQGISLFFIWENFEEIGLIELEEFIKGR